MARKKSGIPRRKKLPTKLPPIQQARNSNVRKEGPDKAGSETILHDEKGGDAFDPSLTNDNENRSNLVSDGAERDGDASVGGEGHSQRKLQSQQTHGLAANEKTRKLEESQTKVSPDRTLLYSSPLPRLWTASERPGLDSSQNSQGAGNTELVGKPSKLGLKPTERTARLSSHSLASPSKQHKIAPSTVCLQKISEASFGKLESAVSSKSKLSGHEQGQQGQQGQQGRKEEVFHMYPCGTVQSSLIVSGLFYKLSCQHCLTRGWAHNILGNEPEDPDLQTTSPRLPHQEWYKRLAEEIAYTKKRSHSRPVDTERCHPSRRDMRRTVESRAELAKGKLSAVSLRRQHAREEAARKAKTSPSQETHSSELSGPATAGRRSTLSKKSQIFPLIPDDDDNSTPSLKKAASKAFQFSKQRSARGTIPCDWVTANLSKLIDSCRSALSRQYSWTDPFAQEPFVLEQPQPGVSAGALRRLPVVQRNFHNQRRFVTLLPDGTGNVYYPSGHLAMLILSPRPGHFTYVVFEDNSLCPVVLACFCASGRGFCSTLEGIPRIAYSGPGGWEMDRKGQPRRQWTWWALKDFVFPLSREFKVGVKANRQIFLAFKAADRKCLFSVGAEPGKCCPLPLLHTKGGQQSGETSVFLKCLVRNRKKIRRSLEAMSALLGLQERPARRRGVDLCPDWLGLSLKTQSEALQADRTDADRFKPVVYVS